MTEVAEAIEGIVALIAGGFVLVLIGSAVEASPTLLDLDTLGIIMMLLGIVVAIAVAAALLGQLLSAIGGR